jgi:hypothetical protein
MQYLLVRLERYCQEKGGLVRLVDDVVSFCHFFFNESYEREFWMADVV